ncbi:uncharacterized protein BDR25DRAFT_300224 [Lindgomyces ingoldianus]|uniref:Uncharacterized protein n=1 Tax=Lindgomyces ingoldianus TaxID=673940 RepID=A0ACB6RER0_9PLEO|nr:uncharacterized protein BDR25DRAFT_300224 [Lindgomyces ingoldianus]KAF2477205.1 hypothetical protein BDR25DRAFT_300224 [Lindgomyces ingoldianus]
MVNVKSLFVGASLLISGIFAAPVSSDVAAPEARSLDRRTFTKAAPDPNNILENTYIVGPNYKSKGYTSATVSDLSGCTALYIWDKAFIPSVFHIFCGQERADGKAAGEMVDELGSQWWAGGAGIFASTTTRAQAVEAGLKEAIPDIRIINTEIYTPGTGDMARTRVTVAKGSNVFNEQNYQGTPTQPGQKN